MAKFRRFLRIVVDDLLSRIELSEHIEPDATAELQPVLRHVVDAMQTLAREREVERKSSRRLRTPPSLAARRATL